MIQALVFDFDGLILETEWPIYQAWRELYRSFGFELSQDKWITIVGTFYGPFDPSTELERLAGKKLDWQALEPHRAARENELVIAQPPLPGVVEYLQEARRRGLKIGLASSSPCEWVVGHLTRLELIHYFDCIRAGDDVRRTKPDPELYLSVLACLGIPADQAIALEDSSYGITAAKRAGLYCVAVPHALTSGQVLEQADLRLDSLAAMPLAQLLAHFNRDGVPA